MKMNENEWKKIHPFFSLVMIGKKWNRCVENCMKACKIMDVEEKFQLVLVIVGIELQDYYEKVV